VAIAVIESTELRADSVFPFLSRAGRELLNEILSRQDATVSSTIWRSPSVYRMADEASLSTLSDNVIDLLEKGLKANGLRQRFDRLLRKINRVQIDTWPG
jgi:hypothetical protein